MNYREKDFGFIEINRRYEYAKIVLTCCAQQSALQIVSCIEHFIDTEASN